MSDDRILEWKEVSDIINRDCDLTLACKFYGISLFDQTYYVPKKKAIRELIKETKIDEIEYKPNVADCDKFAALMRSKIVWWSNKNNKPYSVAGGEVHGMFPFGSMPPGSHAMNWVILKRKNADKIEERLDRYRIWFIEPQRDELFKPRENDTDIRLIFT